MKSIHIVKKATPQGDIDFQLQIKGKLIAVIPKSGNINNQYYQQFIQAYKQKGAQVTEKRQGVIVNIFPGEPRVYKIGQIEIDTEEDSDEVIENKLAKFYIDTFSKGGFEVD